MDISTKLKIVDLDTQTLDWAEQMREASRLEALGDERAAKEVRAAILQALVSSIGPPLARFAQCAVPSRHREDFIVEALLHVVTSGCIERFNPVKGHAEAWLLRHAFQKIRDLWRRERKIAAREVPSDFVDTEGQGAFGRGYDADHLFDQLRLNDVLQAILKLPHQQQVALWMKVEGHSYREIALELSVTENTAGKYVHAARQKLRACDF